MADGRMLSKRVTRSNKVAGLSSDTARMIYSWLIPYTDVEGRMEADPRLLKADIAPLLDHVTAKVINSVLQELHNIGLVILYSSKDGLKQYLQITKFEDNQKNLRKDREAPSHIPDPTADEVRQNSGEGPAELPPKIKIKLSLREEKRACATPPPKIKYLDSVFLTEPENKKLQEALGQKSLDIGIEKLDYSITVKGGKYKDHYKTLLNWFKRGYLVDGGDGNGRRKPDSMGGPGVQLPKEWRGDAIPEISEAERQRNLERVRQLTGGKRQD